MAGIGTTTIPTLIFFLERNINNSNLDRGVIVIFVLAYYPKSNTPHKMYSRPQPTHVTTPSALSSLSSL